jgi:hypothetical protein
VSHDEAILWASNALDHDPLRMIFVLHSIFWHNIGWMPVSGVVAADVVGW